MRLGSVSAGGLAGWDMPGDVGGSILVYAYILMYYTKNRGFENEGFEVEIFLFFATESTDAVLSVVEGGHREISREKAHPRYSLGE